MWKVMWLKRKHMLNSNLKSLVFFADGTLCVINSKINHINNICKFGYKMIKNVNINWMNVDGKLWLLKEKRKHIIPFYRRSTSCQHPSLHM